MKKVLTIFILSIMLLGCSANDDRSSDDSSEVIIADNAELIIGEWSPIRFVFEVEVK